MTGGKSPRRRGDYFERQCKADLERHGWLVIRAGGSLGIADLIAIKREHAPLLVSCKLSNRIDPAERNALSETATRYGATAVVSWRFSNARVAYRRVHESKSDDRAAEIRG